MKKFKDKVVVVTGAGSGMGRAYALAFAKLGSKLALCDLNQGGLNETVDLAREAGCRSILDATLDISKKEDVYSFAARVQAELGNANLVINNAGIEGCAQPTWEIPMATLNKVMAVNFYGVVYGTQAFLPQLLQNKEAALVNVSSISGLIGSPNGADYCASKFAVRGYTESLMAELCDSHVQVHLLHPGGIATNIVQNQNNKKFADTYLTTPSDKVVSRVIKAIQKNQSRIVYGNRAQSTWFGARFIPLNMLVKIIWAEMKGIVDRSSYPSTLNR